MLDDESTDEVISDDCLSLSARPDGRPGGDDVVNVLDDKIEDRVGDLMRDRSGDSLGESREDIIVDVM
jgi:hypothetical protein